jgi:threonine synthase
VPSGNFGNALGGYYAMKMGLPVEKILISSNRNNVLTDWIHSGEYRLRGREVQATSSPAMDILKSSNVERVLFDLYGAARTRELMEQLDAEGRYQLDDDELARLQAVFSADFADDEEVETAIRETYEQHGYLMDPHTATCLKAHASRRDQALPDIVYSTAEWTKFSPTIAHALTGEQDAHDIDALRAISKTTGLAIPPMIAGLFERPIAQGTVIDKREIERAVLDFV